MSPEEPNLKDLADKFKLTKDERAQGVAADKATQRNTLCACGCGKKAKKCQNGRTVLQFKKLLRGSVLTEVLLFLCAVMMLTLIWGSVKKNMAKDCGESIVIQKTVYTNTTGFDGEIVNGTLNTLQSKP